MFHLCGEVRLAMVKEVEKNYLSECSHCYCAFHKHANSEVQKPTDVCIFHCCFVILAELLGNRSLFQ